MKALFSLFQSALCTDKSVNLLTSLVAVTVGYGVCVVLFAMVVSARES